MTKDKIQNQTKAKKEYVPVEIRPETRKLLAIVKAKYGFRSYDELIKHLLKVAGYADQ
jgi:hypothetical protein